jgi:hypothetical protein
MAESEANVESIFASTRAEELEDLGFPILVKPDALSPAYYDALDRSFPPLEKVVGGTPVEGNKRVRLEAEYSLADPGIPEVWRAFIDHHVSQTFFLEFCRLFGDGVRKTHPHLEESFGKPLEEFSVGLRRAEKDECAANRKYDIVLDLQFGWNSPPSVPGTTVRGPHLDSPIKLFTGLLYFKDSDDDSEGGDLELQRLRRGRYPRPKAARIAPEEVETYRVVPYAANTLVFFVNSPLAIHGVTPRSVTHRPRRFLNFVGECYAVPTPDLFIAPETRSPYLWRQLVRSVVKHFS